MDKPDGAGLPDPASPESEDETPTGTFAGASSSSRLETLSGASFSSGTLEPRSGHYRLLQVCEGIQHAHHKGVIHRDLKPSNILVTVEEGGSPRTKIIDFGLTKAINQPLTDRTLFTELGHMLGTPEYMSPVKALEKDRTRRYDSPADLAADLRRHLGNEPVPATPPSTAYCPRK